MLQKSVWREATMLRSAEVDALLNQTVLVPQTVWSKMQSEETIQVPVSLITDAHGIHFISENNPIHLKQKDGSAATRAPPVSLIFFFF